MSDGGNIPSTGRELIRNLQKRLSMVERGMSTKANAEKVEVLDKYVDQGLANFEAINTDIASIQATLNAATPLPTSSTLMLRDGAGRAQVANPSVDADIATKGYVDGFVRLVDLIDASDLPGAFSNGVTIGSAGTGFTAAFATVRVTKVEDNDARVVQEVFTKGEGTLRWRTSQDASTWGAWQIVGGDTGWLNITWRSGYEQFSGSYSTDVRMIGPEVKFRGLVRPTSGNLISNTNVDLGDLPAGIPAPVNNDWNAGMVTNGDGGAAIVIETDGTIQGRIGTTDTPYIGLGNVSYFVG